MSCLQLTIRPTPNSTRECNEHAEGFRVVFGAIACLQALNNADHDRKDNDLAGRANCERHVRDPVPREGLEIRVVIEAVQDKNEDSGERERRHAQENNRRFFPLLRFLSGLFHLWEIAREPRKRGRPERESALRCCSENVNMDWRLLYLPDR